MEQSRKRAANHITDELLVKLSEHNDGNLTDLEEISLHQQNLEKLEYINRVCANLKQLFLHDNCIGKIENLKRLKKLEYLNMSLNNVELIENLERCESLQKLDLTLNFVGNLVTSVENLRANPQLTDLTLMGNPCANYEGYRDYVIASLPWLQNLDGRTIEKSERLRAIQTLPQVGENIMAQQKKFLRARQDEIAEIQDELDATRGEYEDPNLNPHEQRRKFYQSKSRNTPEYRQETSRKVFQFRNEDEKAQQFHVDDELYAQRPRNPPKRFFNDEGLPLNINQARLDFTYDDSGPVNLVLEVNLYKHMSTTDVKLDVEPQYVRLTLKDKQVFQLRLMEEIRSDASTAQRSQNTGQLVITMPKLQQIPMSKAQVPIPVARVAATSPCESKLEVTGPRGTVDYTNIVASQGVNAKPELESVPELEAVED